jgi:hypothetical protein
MKLDGGSSMMKTIIMMKVIPKINRKSWQNKGNPGERLMF